MSGSQFSITSAIRNAYAFLGQYGGEVLRLSILPLGIGIATQAFFFFQLPNSTAFEGFLISLPATVLHGWFMFAMVRLLLLDEHVNALPNDREYLLDRRYALRVSVLIWLLFNAAYSGIFGFQEWATQGANAGQNSAINLIGLVLLFLGLWGLRFGVAHILAAVDYPIKPYFFAVNGMGISLRLLGLAIIAALPVGIALYCVLAVIAPDIKDKNHVIGLIYALSTPVSFLVTAILTPAACFALKEILGRVRLEKGGMA